MRKLKTFWIINVLAMLVIAPAVNGAGKVEITTAPGYKFAGYTEQKASGAAGGYGGMNAKCQAGFGKNARMCTTKEWFNTHGTAAPQPGEMAWVQPIPVTVYYNPALNDVVWTEWTGHTFRGADIGLQSAQYTSRTQCQQWTTRSAQSLGYVVFHADPIGVIIARDFCDNPHRVTCCTNAR